MTVDRVLSTDLKTAPVFHFSGSICLHFAGTTFQTLTYLSQSKMESNELKPAQIHVDDMLE